jgi:hypothetical protein
MSKSGSPGLLLSEKRNALFKTNEKFIDGKTRKNYLPKLL